MWQEFMKERGLKLSEEKTATTNINDGFDFLGWNFRKFKGKLLIQPSTKSKKKITKKLSQTVRYYRESKQELLIVKLNQIFERLYKCDKGRSEKGSGLGLSIVHQLVEKMGGSITVESVPGKGTEFTLLFPLEI